MIAHKELTDKELKRLIKDRKISYGGNRRLNIYGTLSCNSGKKMKRENRVFFTSEDEALKNGYRPCGHCLREKYKKWKDGVI